VSHYRRGSRQRATGRHSAVEESNAMKRRLSAVVAALCAFLACSASAQLMPGEVARQRMERQQYQDELLLKQRQFEQSIDPSLTGPQRIDLERRQLEQRQRQRELHSEQQQRQIQLDATLPKLPENRQNIELMRSNGEFARQRQQLLDELQFDP
jgi:hypothetical protein